MTNSVITLENVSHSYGSFPVLKSIGFSLEKGDITGFLGPNGAGKTTTFRILTGLLKPLEGRVSILGMNPFKDLESINSKMGYLPEHPPVYPEMRIREYLEFIMDLRDIPYSKRGHALGAALEKTGLDKRKEQIISTLSKGYMQRVGLAQAVIHDPQILLLDEPAGGLDPVQTLGLIRRIRAMAGDYTVLFSSHDLFMASRICKNYIMLFDGVIRGAGSSNELAFKAGLGWKYVFEFFPGTFKKSAKELKQELILDIKKLFPKVFDETFLLEINSEKQESEKQESEQLETNTLAESLESNTFAKPLEKNTFTEPWKIIVSSAEDIRPEIVGFLVKKGCLVIGVKKEEVMVERIFEKLFIKSGGAE